MSITIGDEIKRWTARRKSALVLEIIQGKTTIAEAARQFDLPPTEIEEWIDQGNESTDLFGLSAERSVVEQQIFDRVVGIVCFDHLG